MKKTKFKLMHENDKQQSKNRRESLIARAKKKQASHVSVQAPKTEQTVVEPEQLVRLRQQVKRLKKENGTLKAQHQVALTKQASMQRIQYDLKASCAELKRQLVQQREIIGIEKHRGEQLDKQVRDKQTRIEEQRDEVATLNGLINYHKAQTVRVSVTLKKTRRRERLLVRRVNNLQKEVHQLEGHVYTTDEIAVMRKQLRDYKQFRHAMLYMKQLEEKVAQQSRMIMTFKQNNRAVVKQAVASERERLADLQNQAEHLMGIPVERLIGALGKRTTELMQPEKLRPALQLTDTVLDITNQLLGAKQNEPVSQARVNHALSQISFGKLRHISHVLYGVLIPSTTHDLSATYLNVPISSRFRVLSQIGKQPVAFRSIDGDVETVMFARTELRLVVGDVVRANVVLTPDEREYILIDKVYPAPAKTETEVANKREGHGSKREADGVFVAPAFVENTRVLAAKKVLIVSSQKMKGIENQFNHLGVNVTHVYNAKRNIRQIYQALDGHQYDLILVDKAHTSHAATEAVRLAHQPWAQVLQRGLSINEVVRRAYNYFLARETRRLSN